jgi:hypothetical protein
MNVGCAPVTSASSGSAPTAIVSSDAAALVALAAACATSGPTPRDADRAGATEALKRYLAADADGYVLVSVDDALPPGTKAATFEKVLAQRGGPVERTQVAVCNGSASDWRCIGPIDGARIAHGAKMQRVVTGGEMDDGMLVAIADYVASACFADQMRALEEQRGPGYGRAHRAGGELQGIERDGGRFLISLGDRAGFDIITVERAAAGAACAFEVQDVRSLMVAR